MKSPLREVVRVRQVPGELRRRWFSSDALDLVVWFDDDGVIAGFQLCYDKLHAERALTWHARGHRLQHMAVDDGEPGGMRHKSSPVLVPDGVLDAPKLLAEFRAAAGELPPAIVAAVVAQLGDIAPRP